jgi:hypothetical protein
MHEGGVEEHRDGESDTEQLARRVVTEDERPNTLIMISAADVITRAVLDSPLTTDPWLSPVLTYSSRTRDSRNTSSSIDSPNRMANIINSSKNDIATIAAMNHGSRLVIRSVRSVTIA